MNSEKIYWWMTLFLAECFASIFLLFLGCMSEVDNSGLFTPTRVTVGIAFGLAVMIGINSFNVSSGGFMSPIIVVYCYINKLFDIPTCFVYFFGQIVGSLIGYSLVRAIVPIEFLSHPERFCMCLPGAGVSPGLAFVIEFMNCFIFMTFVAAVLHPKNERWHDSATIKFGLLVMCLVIVNGPFAISLNPARALAPALYNWKWDHHWIFWVAPFSGSFVASILYKYVFGRDFSHLKEEKEVKSTHADEEITYSIDDAKN